MDCNYGSFISDLFTSNTTLDSTVFEDLFKMSNKNYREGVDSVLFCVLIVSLQISVNR